MNNTVWFGKYRILKSLGKGGSAEVYLAEHMKLSSLCAIKRVHKGHPLHGQLLYEAVILKNLSHPCIPVIYDFEEEEEYSYIIEQYMEGILLKDFVKQEGRLKEQDVISIGVSICDLFLYLYSLDHPVLYLDLNPCNIILNNGSVKLIDFGACVLREKADERKYILGTRGFFAPELLKKEAPGEKSDVYAVGALLYYLITGGKKYGERSLPPGRTALRLYSGELLRVIQKACRHHSVFRYSHVAMLKKKLEGRRRKKTGIIPGESICIAVTGTQTRIGATHFALLMANYLNGKGVRCLYQECNPSGHLKKMIHSVGAVLGEDGIWHYKGCHLLPFSELSSQPAGGGYRVIIKDYGTGLPEKEESFGKEDVRLLVGGAKAWEQEGVLDAMKGEGGGSAKILLNFLNGKQYRDFCNKTKGRDIYRIPYEPDPFARCLSGETGDLMEELLEGKE